MAEITVELRAPLICRVRCTVLLMFESAAEALHFTLSAHDPGATREARQHFVRLTELARVLDQIGWTTKVDPDDLEVAAEPDVLHDAILGSLLDAGEGLATDLHHGGGDVRGAAEEVVAFDSLLRKIGRHR